MNDQEMREFEGALKRIVSDLPEEGLSLTWRSELNEKLRALPVTAPRRFAFWKPVAGLALASALAVVAFVPRSGVNPTSPSDIEDQLVRTHISSAADREVAGTGLTAHESQRETLSLDTSSSWTEADLSL